MKGIRATIRWKSEKVIFGDRVFLFCFGKKCMSGKVSDCQKSEGINEYKANVLFIEPDYFFDEIVVDKDFEVREASKVLGNGRVEKII